MQSGRSSATLTSTEVVDLMHFLRQRINDTLRGSPVFTVQDIVTGDATAGEAYFSGNGGCTACHSTTGDLAGLGHANPGAGGYPAAHAVSAARAGAAGDAERSARHGDVTSQRRADLRRARSPRTTSS